MAHLCRRGVGPLIYFGGFLVISEILLMCRPEAALALARRLLVLAVVSVGGRRGQGPR